MFINRKDELKALNLEYSKSGTRFGVIYGRRRVGKTALISEFIKDKFSLYFYATTSSSECDKFGKELAKVLNLPHFEKMKFDSFSEAFSLLDGVKLKQKLIIVIDEFQNLAISNKEFIAEFQKIFDTMIKKSNIFLIVCGSVISMMHSLVLNYNAPLYGRRTINLHIHPLKFSHIKEFLPKTSKLEQVKIYSSFGTIPKYLESYNENLNFTDNLEQNLLNKNSYLYSEGQFLLNSEISEPASYFSILESISNGNSKIGNIAGNLKVSSSYLTRYLSNLIELDLVEKEIPVTEQNPLKSKFGRYKIIDNYLKFWFYYVYKNYSYLEIGNTAAVLKEIELNFADRFMSFAFEDIIKELILENPLEMIGFMPLKVGRWWDNKSEIDLIALNESEICFIECKWQNSVNKSKIESILMSKSLNLVGDKKPNFKVFTKEWFLGQK